MEDDQQKENMMPPSWGLRSSNGIKGLMGAEDWLMDASGLVFQRGSHLSWCPYGLPCPLGFADHCVQV